MSFSEIVFVLSSLLNGQYVESNNELYCLTGNIYFESRGDGVASMVGVANNVMFRVDSDYYPDTVCGVVHDTNPDGCGYSWWCDGKRDVLDFRPVVDKQAFIQAYLVADAFINGEERPLLGRFQGVLLYHAVDADPKWARSNLTKYVGAMGSHMFYLESRSTPFTNSSP